MKLKEIQEKFLENAITKPDYIDRMHEVHRMLYDYASFIRDTDIARIEIADGRVVMTSREAGIRIVCDNDDKRIVPIEILNFGHYEKNDSDMIFHLVENGDNILDIGANIGWYSINFAKRFPQCSIFAFEPIPKTYAYLQENIELNSVSNINTFNHGFSDEAKELVFYYYPAGSGNASSARLADAPGMEEIRCSVLPLDDFVASRDINVDFIKCDVEGAEFLVFKGGLKTLGKHRPIVFTEMLRKWSAKFDYHPNEIIKLFSELGYRCFTAKGGKLVEFFLMDENTLETNFFFLHQEKHAEKISSNLAGAA